MSIILASWQSADASQWVALVWLSNSELATASGPYATGPFDDKAACTKEGLEKAAENNPHSDVDGFCLEVENFHRDHLK